ncbi:hypothetical protein M0259_004654 [Salmonella enterica]|nr:hypothetical protein [Salmonella enterica]
MFDFIKNKKKYESLRGLGLVGVIVDAFEALETMTMSSVIELFCNFHVWFEVNEISDLDWVFKYQSLIYGITARYTDKTIWDIIAWRIISRLDVKIFIYGINCHKIRQCLCYLVDYMQGDLWPSVYFRFS